MPTSVERKARRGNVAKLETLIAPADDKAEVLPLVDTAAAPLTAWTGMSRRSG